MVHEYDLVKEIVRRIESNISDPNRERASLGKKWVYEDVPDMRLGASNYPRITVQHVVSVLEDHAMNTNDYRQTATIAIQIRVKKGMTYTQADGTKKRDTEILTCLGDDIITLFKEDVILDAFADDLCVFRLRADNINTIEKEQDRPTSLLQIEYNAIMVR